MEIKTCVLLTMVLRNICLLGLITSANPEILVTLVQLSSGFLNQVKKEAVVGGIGEALGKA